MAPRRATLSGSVPVGSGIWGKRGWGGGGTAEAGVVACGAGVMSHTTRADTHSKPQRRSIMRAEAGGTIVSLCVGPVTFLLTGCEKICTSLCVMSYDYKRMSL